MSFSSDVKAELCRIKGTRSCCLLAECAGMLLFARHLSEEKISFYTEYDYVAEHLCYLLKKRFKITAEHTVTDKGVNKVTVPDASDRAAIIARMKTGDRPCDSLLKNDCCVSAFLRGAFLSCGIVTDPNKGYRLEFVCPSHIMAQYLFALLVGMIDGAKMAERDGQYCVYYKYSTAIEDFLTVAGAVNSSLSLMEIKVVKDMRNKLNRVNNFENANLKKTVNAAVDQLNAIKKLADSGVLDTLPDPLRETAALRADNPDASLKSLCELSGMSRSGLNHRLQRLVELANEL